MSCGKPSDMKIQVGMSPSEVENLMGIPQTRTLDPNGETWTYTYHSTKVGFTNGAVSSVDSSTVKNTQ
jgi:outer membrane protein assembly factor BamE (lipoprotein component of BamABCDE complex)